MPTDRLCLYAHFGIVEKCQVIVADGISIGCPCCGVFRCTEPLPNNRHLFCLTHDDLHNVCHVVGCEEPVVVKETVVDGKAVRKRGKACMLPMHQAMEKKKFAKGKAAFILKDRFKIVQGSHPTEVISAGEEQQEPGVEEDIEVYYADGDEVTLHSEKNPGTVGVVDEVSEPCPSKAPAGNNLKPLKALFNRRRTHNEQTLVRPCGVIYARATMYGAEAVSNFLIMVKNAFSVPGAQKPDHIFYDTNCDAKQQAMNDSWFDNIGMCVDVWHFLNKHKVTHRFCQENCNPVMYPELEDEEGNWYFNTSVAEQTNAWLGGYHSMCREMLPAKFDFFLDEMIRLRNVEVIARLAAAGHNPSTL